jgi:DHA1 family bicyclomycin/chloramphenicol resistance-like MFS transporter
MLFGVMSVFMIGASQVNGLLVGRVDPARLLHGAVALSVLGTVLMVGVSVWGCWYAPVAYRPYEVWLVIGTMVIALAPTGIIFPNAMMMALADHPAQAGAASALAGTLQYVLGALAGVLVGQFAATSSLPMAGCMGFGALMMLCMHTFRPALHDVA